MTLPRVSTSTVAELIADYEPRIVSDWEWKKIRHAVTECGTYYFRRKGVLDGNLPYGRVHRTLLAITRAATYVRRHGGDLTMEVIAAPDVLQAVIREEAVDHAYLTTQNYIFDLTDFGRTVQPQQWTGVKLRHPKIPGRSKYLPTPLTEAELKAARAWCNRDSATVTRNATVLVALALGAGLRTAEIATRRVGHLRVDEWGVVWVDISDARGECFAPEVPVSMSWADDLVQLIDSKARDAFLVAPEQEGVVRHRVVQATIKKLNVTAPGGKTVDFKALRSNWIMSLYAQGVSPRLVSYLVDQAVLSVLTSKPYLPTSKSTML